MRLLAIVAICALATYAPVLAQSAPQTKTVKVFVQGDSNRLTDFVEQCQREFANHGLRFELVPFDGDFQYNIVIAQETSIYAASAVIVLDKNGRFVASVVRSGRATGKGALNAAAKELAKKLAVLSQ